MTRSFPAALALVLVTVGCAPIQRYVRHKDPLTPAEHYQLGAAYEQKGELKAAQREYRAAAKGDRKDLPAHIALGNVAFAQGDNKEAEAAFRRALRISRTNAAANNNLAMLYASQGRRLDDAERLARRAQDDPRFRPYALDTLATIYGRQGRLDEARAAVAEARRSPPPDDPTFLTHLDETERSLARSGEKGGEE